MPVRIVGSWCLSYKFHEKMTKIDDYDTDSGSFDDRKREGDGSFEGG